MKRMFSNKKVYLLGVFCLLSFFFVTFYLLFQSGSTHAETTAVEEYTREDLEALDIIEKFLCLPDSKFKVEENWGKTCCRVIELLENTTHEKCRQICSVAKEVRGMTNPTLIGLKMLKLNKILESHLKERNLSILQTELLKARLNKALKIK